LNSLGRLIGMFSSYNKLNTSCYVKPVTPKT
jgi:hypothetical protein